MSNTNDEETIHSILQSILDFLKQMDYTLFNDEMKPFSESYINMALKASKNSDVVSRACGRASSDLYDRQQKNKKNFDDMSEKIAECATGIKALEAILPNDIYIGMLSNCERFEKQIKKLHGISNNFK